MKAPETRFQKLFPYLKSSTLDITERGKGVIKGFETRSMDETTYDDPINCSNPRCEGRIFLSPILRSNIQRGVTKMNQTAICPGAKRTGFCANSFQIDGTVTFKDPESPTSTSA